MPMINIEFDDSKVQDSDIQKLSEAVQRIVSETTKIEDVFVYANSAKIKVKIAPIEIWVRITASKIVDVDELMSEIRNKLSNWKKSENFPHPINLSLVPMNWKVEINI